MATITIEAPDSCADALARIDGLCLGEYGVEDVIRSALWELSDDVEEIAGASEFSADPVAGVRSEDLCYR